MFSYRVADQKPLACFGSPSRSMMMCGRAAEMLFCWQLGGIKSIPFRPSTLIATIARHASRTIALAHFVKSGAVRQPALA
jgi:hypothetical protein